MIPSQIFIAAIGATCGITALCILYIHRAKISDNFEVRECVFLIPEEGNHSAFTSDGKCPYGIFEKQINDMLKNGYEVVKFNSRMIHLQKLVTQGEVRQLTETKTLGA